MRVARRVASAVLVVGLVVVAGCGSGSSPEVQAGPEGTPDPQLVVGRSVFVDRCASCHDGDGSGTTNGPGLNRGRLLQAYPDPQAAAAVVSEGKNRMPGFGSLLSVAEIEATLRYINEVL